MVEDAAPKGRSNLISLLPVVSRNSTADPNNTRDNPSQQWLTLFVHFTAERPVARATKHIGLIYIEG